MVLVQDVEGDNVMEVEQGEVEVEHGVGDPDEINVVACVRLLL